MCQEAPSVTRFYRPMSGEWKGHRSSRLSQQYRIIYKVDGDRLLVEVVEVNPHDYGKKI